MKLYKRILSVVLCILICFGSVSVIAFAKDKEENKTLTIFVDGFASVGLYNEETGESLFPPSAGKILSAVGPVIPGLVNSINKHDFGDVADPIADAAINIFEDLICDMNGNPYVGVADYEFPSDEEIAEAIELSDEKSLFFSYDWRCSVQALAGQLHELIEYIVENFGVESVSLIGFSMGTCVVMTYLKMYDYQYIDGVILLAGAYNGVSSCGMPFAGRLGLDSDATVRFVDAMLGDDFVGVLVSSLLHTLNATGVLDGVVNIGTELIDSLKDVVYGRVFEKTFALIPGMWSLVPYEYYEEARKVYENGEDFDKEYVDMVDWYHYEVQAHNEDIINGILERGIRFGIVAKYGLPNTPCIEDINSMSDGVIDTRYESYGATCADVNTTLGENYVQKVDNGHNCVSCDNMIDASTAKYCQYTWFIKNSQHSADASLVKYFCLQLLRAEEQMTVWSDPEKPQFLIMENGEINPLTSENDFSLYKADMSDETPWSIILDFFKKLFNLIKNLFKK